MFKWLFHILIFATGKYQNKEKPLKRQRKLRLALIKTKLPQLGVSFDNQKHMFKLMKFCFLYTSFLCRNKTFLSVCSSDTCLLDHSEVFTVVKKTDIAASD